MKNKYIKPILVSTESRKSGETLWSFGNDDFGLNLSKYINIRKNLPVVDAAINKIIRLAGGFHAETNDRHMQGSLDDFVNNADVNLSGKSLQNFSDSYLDSLLTFGAAFGQIVPNKNGEGIAGLLNINPGRLAVRAKSADEPFEKRYFIKNGRKESEIKNPELMLFSAINPLPGNIMGRSILEGISYYENILLKIFRCMELNAERAGNVRYAVTYNPGDNPEDRARAADRVRQIAAEWKKGMDMSGIGEVRDFVAAGDVSIKVIGSDNNIPDLENPLRDCLEQIISKLGVPPFLLGFNWTTSERMSEHQCDILTSELLFYRRQLTPVLEKICRTFLRYSGSTADAKIVWDEINLQDEVEHANARLLNAQADSLEKE